MRIVPKTPSVLSPFEQFQQQFRAAFGRELTREERRFYRLVNIVLQEAKLPATSAQPANLRNSG